MHLQNITCDPVPLAAAGALSVVPLLQVLLNGFVAVAAIRSRKKLESNFVCANVTSLLSANVLYGLLTAYSLLIKAYGFEHGSSDAYANSHMIDNERGEHARLKLWWVFRSALQISAYLTMSANVSALIYSLRQNSYFVGPAGVSMGSSEHGSCLSSKVKKYRVAAVMFATWIGPFILSIVATAHWNCVDMCVCFDGYYKDRYICQADKYRRCSRVFETISNSFVQTMIVIWFLLAVLMVAMVAFTFRKYRLVASIPNNSVAFKPGGEGTTQNGEKGDEGEQDGRITFKRLQFQSAPKFSRLSYSVRSMILISILFLICTTPVMILLLVDSLSQDYVLNLASAMPCIVVVYVYGIASPIILVHYMYGLRYAVISLLQAMSCHSTTVVVRRGVANSRAKNLTCARKGSQAVALTGT